MKNDLVSSVISFLKERGIEWAKDSSGRIAAPSNVHVGSDEKGNFFFLDLSTEEVFLSFDQPDADDMVEIQLNPKTYTKQIAVLLS